MGVVGFNDGVKAEILKSKMSGKYTPVPAQYPAGTAIDTPARFLAWLRHKYHEETIGSRNASLSRLAQEKFNPTDTPKPMKIEFVFYCYKHQIITRMHWPYYGLTYLMNYLQELKSQTQQI